MCIKGTTLIICQTVETGAVEKLHNVTFSHAYTLWEWLTLHSPSACLSSLRAAYSSWLNDDFPQREPVLSAWEFSPAPQELRPAHRCNVEVPGRSCPYRQCSGNERKKKRTCPSSHSSRRSPEELIAGVHTDDLRTNTVCFPSVSFPDSLGSAFSMHSPKPGSNPVLSTDFTGNQANVLVQQINCCEGIKIAIFQLTILLHRDLEESKDCHCLLLKEVWFISNQLQREPRKQ